MFDKYFLIQLPFFNSTFYFKLSLASYAVVRYNRESMYPLAISSNGNILKNYTMGGRSQDGGGIGRGDHFLFYKFIERTTER